MRASELGTRKRFIVDVKQCSTFEAGKPAFLMPELTAFWNAAGGGATGAAAAADVDVSLLVSCGTVPVWTRRTAENRAVVHHCERSALARLIGVTSRLETPH